MVLYNPYSSQLPHPTRIPWVPGAKRAWIPLVTEGITENGFHGNQNKGHFIGMETFFFFSFMVTISFRLHCKVFNYYFQHFLRILLPVDTLKLDCEQCLMVFF